MSDAIPMPHRDHFAGLARTLVGEGRDWATVHHALDERDRLARDAAAAAAPAAPATRKRSRRGRAPRSQPPPGTA